MVKVRQNLMSSSLYSWKSPYSMRPTRIVVHNTANDASADAEIKYMNKNQAQGGSQVSYHYAVDDVEAVQGLPENRNAWHSGDGNGKGNREGIAIEICYSKSGGDRFNKAEENAAELIAGILKRYGWGIDKVTKHQDYANKYCPHRTLDMGWERFLNMVRSKMGNSVSQVTNEPDQILVKGSKVKFNGIFKVDILKSPLSSNLFGCCELTGNSYDDYYNERVKNYHWLPTSDFTEVDKNGNPTNDQLLTGGTSYVKNDNIYTVQEIDIPTNSAKLKIAGRDVWVYSTYLYEVSNN